MDCGVDIEDISLERLTSDLVMKLTRFALYCNAHVTRNPKKLMATIMEIGRNLQAFRKNPERFDPEATALVLGEAARLSDNNAKLILKWERGEGSLNKVKIKKAVSLVLDILRIEAQELPRGAPTLTFQSELAWDLGTIFHAYGGKLRRNPKQLGKTPFRSFVELMIVVVKPFAEKAGFELTATTMIEKAQKQLKFA